MEVLQKIPHGLKFLSLASEETDTSLREIYNCDKESHSSPFVCFGKVHKKSISLNRQEIPEIATTTTAHNRIMANQESSPVVLKQPAIHSNRTSNQHFIAKSDKLNLRVGKDQICPWWSQNKTLKLLLRFLLFVLWQLLNLFGL